MNTEKLFVLLALFGICSCHNDDVKNTYTLSGKVNSVLFWHLLPNFEMDIDTFQFAVDLISDDQIIATSDDTFFTFTGLEEGRSYIILPEQLGTDREGMTALDYAMIDHYIREGDGLDAFQKLAADVNRDNLIDSTDLELILNCILDTDQCFNWRFATDDYDGNGLGQADQYVINNLMSDVGIHFIPINTGDMTGTHNPH